MPTVDPTAASLPPGLEGRFWSRLHDALVVIKADGDLAEQYRAELRKASRQEKWLALHDEPIDVAAKLAGVSVTQEQLATYDNLKRGIDDQWRFLQDWFTKSAVEFNPPRWLMALVLLSIWVLLALLVHWR